MKMRHERDLNAMPDDTGHHAAGAAAGAECESEPDGPRRLVWLPGHAPATAERLARMSTRQLAALRGQGTVFVHLTDTGLAHAAGGNPGPAGSTAPGNHQTSTNRKIPTEQTPPAARPIPTTRDNRPTPEVRSDPTYRTPG